MRRKVLSLLAAPVLFVGLALAAENVKLPDAHLNLQGGSVAAGVGVNWGSGHLLYKGKSFPVKVTGLSVADVGATKLTAFGNVYNLSKIDDFNGNYAGVGASGAVGGGGGIAMLRNQHGVEIELVSTTQGVDVGLGGGGVNMQIAR